MRSIQPVRLGDNGPKVSNLHKGLLFLITFQKGISPNDRKTLRGQLGPDLREHKFGDGTARLVALWQYQFQNWPDYMPPFPKEIKAIVKTFPTKRSDAGTGTGAVDEATAKVLNWLLKESGAV